MTDYLFSLLLCSLATRIRRNPGSFQHVAYSFRCNDRFHRFFEPLKTALHYFFTNRPLEYLRTPVAYCTRIAVTVRLSIQGFFGNS